MSDGTAISPRCRKCGRDLGSSFLYSGDGFTYHSECYPVSPRDAELAALQQALSIEKEAREKAERERDEANQRLMWAHGDKWAELVGAGEDRKRAEQLERDLAEARRLLKPFADIGDVIGTGWSSVPDSIALRDFRAAARFLNGADHG